VANEFNLSAKLKFIIKICIFMEVGENRKAAGGVAKGKKRDRRKEEMAMQTFPLNARTK